MQIEKQAMKRMLFGFMTLCLILTQSACATYGNKTPTVVDNDRAHLISLHLDNMVSAEAVIDPHARKAIEAMRSGRLQEATAEFNIVLSQNFNSSPLQLFNGINYHLRALAGESALFSMAEQGYLAAIRFDKSNWAARYYLGLFYMDSKRYLEAQHHFGAYVLQNNADPEGLYYLAISSYYSADPQTATIAAKRLWELTGTMQQPPIDPAAMLQLLAISTAAISETDDAVTFVDDYLSEGGDVDHALLLRKRIEDWHHFYTEQNKPEQDSVSKQEDETTIAEEMAATDEDELDSMSEMDESMSMSDVDDEGMGFDTEVMDEGFATDDEFAADDEDLVENEEQYIENQMVAVDVTIIRSEEVETTTKGINLLNGLQLQFGDELNGINAFSRLDERARDFTDPTLSTQVRTITRLIRARSL